MIAGLLWLRMTGWMLGQQTSRVPNQKPQANAEAVARYMVTGVVVDAVSGQPLPNAKMSLDTVENMSRDNEDDSESTMLSDVDGRFVFENLAAGHYVLWGTRKGYVGQRYKQHGTFSTAIVLGQGQSAESLRFEMTPDASIVGQITDEMSEPVRLAHVRLVREGRVNGRRKNVVVRNGVTDDLGRYRMDHLQSGTYVVVVSAMPWYAGGNVRARSSESSMPKATQVSDSHPEDANTDVTYPVTYFPSAIDLAAATPIVLHPGDAETANVSMTAVPAVRLTFRKYGSDPDEQTSVASITQMIAEGITERVDYRATESEGMVEVFGLPPGNLNVEWMTTKGSEAKTRSQTIRFGGAGGFEISDESATAPATVRGTIQLDPRLRLQNPVIMLQNSTTFTEVRARTESNGEFKFLQEFTAGTYELSVPRALEASLVVVASGAKTAGTTLEISAGQNVQLKIFASASTGQVTGAAMKDGKPVDGVMVLLVPSDFEHESGMMRIDQSDSDGTFRLARIVPGKYTILGIEDAWKAEWSSAEFLRKFLAGGQVVEVGADAKLKVNVNVQKNMSPVD